MNSNYSRFRVNALIQMARTTENQDKREEYIALAENELLKLSDSEYHESSMEMFFEEKCVFDGKSKTDRGELYKKYVEYCKKKKMPYFTRNALYRFLRENAISEVRGKRDYFFNIRIID